MDARPLRAPSSRCVHGLGSTQSDFHPFHTAICDKRGNGEGRLLSDLFNAPRAASAVRVT